MLFLTRKGIRNVRVKGTEDEPYMHRVFAVRSKHIDKTEIIIKPIREAVRINNKYNRYGYGSRPKASQGVMDRRIEPGGEQRFDLQTGAWNACIELSNAEQNAITKHLLLSCLLDHRLQRGKRKQTPTPYPLCSSVLYSSSEKIPSHSILCFILCPFSLSHSLNPFFIRL